MRLVASVMTPSIPEERAVNLVLELQQYRGQPPAPRLERIAPSNPPWSYSSAASSPAAFLCRRSMPASPALSAGANAEAFRQCLARRDRRDHPFPPSAVVSFAAALSVLRRWRLHRGIVSSPSSLPAEQRRRRPIPDVLSPWWTWTSPAGTYPGVRDVQLIQRHPGPAGVGDEVGDGALGSPGASATSRPAERLTDTAPPD